MGLKIFLQTKKHRLGLILQTDISQGQNIYRLILSSEGNFSDAVYRIISLTAPYKKIKIL